MSVSKKQDNVTSPKPIKRHYLVTEKKQIVTDILKGIYTIPETLERYKINDRTLDSWLITFGTEEALEFKRKIHDKSHRRIIASQVHSGLLSVNEAARQNKVSGSTIRGWLYQYQSSNNLAVENTQQPMSSPNTDKDIEKQIETLRLKIISLETMIDLAEEQYNIDIRKKCGTKQQ